jgi:hypothetical protein
MDLNNIKEKTQFLNIVAFAILMENGKGVLDKAPDYVLEKFNRYIKEKSEEKEWEWGLDAHNKFKLLKYVQKWIKPKEEVK